LSRRGAARCVSFVMVLAWETLQNPFSALFQVPFRPLDQ
jgi:hypothetical protein